MLDKLKDLFDRQAGADVVRGWFEQFRDVRAIGLVLFLGVALMVTWSGAKVIQTNYELQKQISQLEQEIAVQKLANQNIKLRNQYFQTEQYLELQARQDFGLGGRGETQLIVPSEVAQKYITPMAAADSGKKELEVRLPAYQRNFQAWIDFFMHRPGEVDTELP
jgi:cell division protein FtsB